MERATPICRRLSQALLLVLLAAQSPAYAGYGGADELDPEGIERLELPAAGRASLPAGISLLRDVAYGDAASQRMDIYKPQQAKGAPVIFMVHGGAWRTGDKGSRAVVQNKVLRWVTRGAIFISVNYPLLPQEDALEQADEIAHALAYAQAHAMEWGGDPKRFVLMGHSAGAHLVALLNSAPHKAYTLGARPWLGTIALDSAALDVVSIMHGRRPRFYQDAFGSNEANWRLASPLHMLAAGAPPLLAVCSTKRRDNPCAQAHAYAAKAEGMRLRVVVLGQAMTHRQINQELGQPGAYTKAVEAFLATLDPFFRGGDGR